MEGTRKRWRPNCRLKDGVKEILDDWGLNMLEGERHAWNSHLEELGIQGLTKVAILPVARKCRFLWGEYFDEIILPMVQPHQK